MSSEENNVGRDGWAPSGRPDPGGREGGNFATPRRITAGGILAQVFSVVSFYLANGPCGLWLAIAASSSALFPFYAYEWDRAKRKNDNNRTNALRHRVARNPFFWLSLVAWALLAAVLVWKPGCDHPDGHPQIIIDTAASLVHPAENQSPLDEYMCIINISGDTVNMAGWRLSDTVGTTYTFPKYELGAGRSVRIHTVKGNDTISDLYWDRGKAVWTDNGDTATLTRPDGTVEDQKSYPPRAAGAVQGQCRLRRSGGRSLSAERWPWPATRCSTAGRVRPATARHRRVSARNLRDLQGGPAQRPAGLDDGRQELQLHDEHRRGVLVPAPTSRRKPKTC